MGFFKCTAGLPGTRDQPSDWCHADGVTPPQRHYVVFRLLIVSCNVLNHYANESALDQQIINPC